MDPNAALEDIRSLVTEITSHADRSLPVPEDTAARLAELVGGLDGWITRGGSLPTDWLIAIDHLTHDTITP